MRLEMFITYLTQKPIHSVQMAACSQNYKVWQMNAHPLISKTVEVADLMNA